MAEQSLEDNVRHLIYHNRLKKCCSQSVSQRGHVSQILVSACQIYTSLISASSVY